MPEQSPPPVSTSGPRQGVTPGPPPRQLELWEQVRQMQFQLRELEARLAASVVATPAPALGLVADPVPPEFRTAEVEERQSDEPMEVLGPTYWQTGFEDPLKVAKPPADADADEIQWGGKIMPWVGGIFMACGLIILTSFGIQRGLITPPIQFGLAVLLCVVMGVLGEFLRAKQHQLAQVVAGLASFGGFVTIIGGYSTFKIYTDQTAFLLMLNFSASNIGYSYLRRWEVFSGGGLAGGLIASLMVTKNPALGLTTALVSGLVVGIVGAHLGWRRIVWLAYIATASVVTFKFWYPNLDSLFPLLAYHLRFVVPSALMIAYILRNEKGQDRASIFLPAFWVIGAVYLTYPSVTIYGLNPYLMWSIWGVPLAVLAWREREDLATAGLLASAAWLSVTVLQPLSLPSFMQPAVWLGLSAIGASVTYRFRHIACFAVTVGWQMMSIGAWAAYHSMADKAPEFWLAHLAIHGILVYMMRESKEIKNLDSVTKTVGLIAGMLPLAFMTSFSIYGFAPISQSAAVTLTFLTIAAAFSVVGLLFHSVVLRYVGWTSWAALVLKIYLVDFLSMSEELRIVTLLASGITALTVAGFYLRKQKARPG